MVQVFTGRMPFLSPNKQATKPQTDMG